MTKQSACTNCADLNTVGACSAVYIADDGCTKP